MERERERERERKRKKKERAREYKREAALVREKKAGPVPRLQRRAKRRSAVLGSVFAPTSTKWSSLLLLFLVCVSFYGCPAGRGARTLRGAVGFGMEQWGPTRFACKHFPQASYRSHVPLDSRQRRRVYVDVVDLVAPHANLFSQHRNSGHAHGSGRRSSRGGAGGRGLVGGLEDACEEESGSWEDIEDGEEEEEEEGERRGGPEVELVSETTGEAVPLLAMATPKGGFDDDDAPGGAFGNDAGYTTARARTQGPQEETEQGGR